MISRKRQRFLLARGLPWAGDPRCRTRHVEESLLFASGLVTFGFLQGKQEMQAMRLMGRKNHR